MTKTTVQGPAVCIGDDIDTDLIIAGRYLRTKDRSIWAAHAFEDLDPALASRLHGAVLVAGKNLGCGSSREQAVIALVEAGVQAVVALSCARIFFRNCINVGLIICIAPEFTCNEGDVVVYNPDTEQLTIAGKDTAYHKLSPRMREIISAGGLVPFIRRGNVR